MICEKDFLIIVSDEEKGVTEFPLDFAEKGSVYVQDNRAKNSLNKTLEAQYLAVYRKQSETCNQYKADSIDMETGWVYVVTQRRKVLRFYVSEWFMVTKIN